MDWIVCPTAINKNAALQYLQHMQPPNQGQCKNFQVPSGYLQVLTFGQI